MVCVIQRAPCATVGCANFGRKQHKGEREKKGKDEEETGKIKGMEKGMLPQKIVKRRKRMERALQAL
jgi:hypothetical protein